MSSINDNAKKETFIWTDMSILALCDILNKYVMKYGRTQAFKWSAIQSVFEKTVKHNLTSEKTLKNKYDSMRKDHNLWKFLKNGETGLGWNESTGKLECSDEWWEKKIKENPNVRRIRKKQPSVELQEAWNQLFGDVVASGIDCVAASMDRETLNEVHHVNLEDERIGNDENVDVFSQYTEYSSRLDNLDSQEKSFFRDFINDISQDDFSTPKQSGGSKQFQKTTENGTKTAQLKRKRRESSGSAMFKEFMAQQNANQQRALELMESDSTCNANQTGKHSISTAISVVNQMVNGGLLTTGCTLWCFAITFLRDAVNREMFLNLPDNDARLAWLKYMQNLEN